MTDLRAGPITTGRLNSLTGLRFYAASAVLLCHSVLPLFPVPVLRELAVIGPVGVGLFFVLSGFVLTWSWHPDDRTRDFFIRRGARIYPLHLATTAIAASLFLAGGHHRLIGLVATVLLVQAWFSLQFGEGGHAPSWSLSCEAFFYACFPWLVRRLAVMDRRWLLAVGAAAVSIMGLWNVGYAAVTVAGVPHTAWLSTYTNPGYRIGEFILGMCLACAIRSGWRPPLDPSSALSLAVLWYAVLAALNWLVGVVAPPLGGVAGLPLGALDFLFLPAAPGRDRRGRGRRPVRVRSRPAIRPLAPAAGAVVLRSLPHADPCHRRGRRAGRRRSVGVERGGLDRHPTGVCRPVGDCVSLLRESAGTAAPTTSAHASAPAPSSGRLIPGHQSLGRRTQRCAGRRLKSSLKYGATVSAGHRMPACRRR